MIRSSDFQRISFLRIVDESSWENAGHIGFRTRPFPRIRVLRSFPRIPGPVHSLEYVDSVHSLKYVDFPTSFIPQIRKDSKTERSIRESLRRNLEETDLMTRRSKEVVQSAGGEENWLDRIGGSGTYCRRLTLQTGEWSDGREALVLGT